MRRCTRHFPCQDSTGAWRSRGSCESGAYGNGGGERGCAWRTAYGIVTRRNILLRLATRSERTRISLVAARYSETGEDWRGLAGVAARAEAVVAIR